ncbi:1590_t:CDS:2 [Ambispora leptoticha]|uniref:1590_t:CDS:1 n=1 Tax=Ambispora leptoticha TaxID=144679 RepID=A0A9N9HAD7_9GLOM|nr:1590_t:CDS:2 [Ambispora leptoticha]
MDYTYFLSKKSLNRKPSPIRALVPLLKIPGIISLGAGNPNPETFPFSSFKICLKNGDVLNVEEKEMDEALQYGPTAGLPALIDWLREFQLAMHSPPYDDFAISIGTGSQDLLTKAFEMLIEPGDNVLIESPAYAGALSFLNSQSCTLIVEIETDEQGLIPDSLSSTLSNWPSLERFPKFIYTVPIGNNPTGSSVHIERKRAIFQIAHDFNILILEDDPYYYLQYNNPRIPSYFSLDTDGRVLRFDSMSKILSAGSRVGWVTGPATLIKQIDLSSQSTNLAPSFVTQAIIYALLKDWKLSGFLTHVDKVAAFYKEKRDIFVKYANQYLRDVAQWNVPEAGMFVWIKLKGIEDSNELITKRAIEKKILAMPGEVFLPNPRPSPYIRLSFSNVSEEQMRLALQKLADLLENVSVN